MGKWCSITSGLIRFEERTIYIRVTDEAEMRDILVHEMCHAAAGGEHDAHWLYEMKRVYELGAPVDPSIFRKEGWRDEPGVQEMIDGMHELERRARELGGKGTPLPELLRIPCAK